MKYILWFIILAAVGYFIVVCVPFIQAEASCLAETRKQFDTVGYSSGARGWDPKIICMMKHEVINGLDSCLADAKIQKPVPLQIRSYAERIVGFIRPFDKTLEERVATQNEECIDYPDAIFEQEGL